jgi:AraC-like DNA-binding protein
MTFLRKWRMALAADLLCNSEETVSTVAEKVGYATPFAFSAAFKRVRGISPQDHRESAPPLTTNIPLGGFGDRRHSG